MFKSSIIAAFVAAITVTGAAHAAKPVSSWSSTAQEGFFYDKGQYMKTEVAPHVMRQTDVSVVISSTPSQGATNDNGIYAKTVEVPHTMATPERHVHAASPAPGLYYDQGAYHGYR